MKLELTEAEHELTLYVLQNRLGELRQEIHHSTVSTFTDQLKEKEVLLKGLIGKLGSAQSSGVGS
jgi:hypothetical protein